MQDADAFQKGEDIIVSTYVQNLSRDQNSLKRFHFEGISRTKVNDMLR